MALLQAGRLAALGPRDRVLEPALLAAVYGVPVQDERLPDGRRLCAPDLL